MIIGCGLAGLLAPACGGACPDKTFVDGDHCRQSGPQAGGGAPARTDDLGTSMSASSADGAAGSAGMAGAGRGLPVAPDASRENTAVGGRSGASGAAGRGGGAAAGCGPEGTYRCAQAGAGQRERCQGGAWQAAPCKPDETCAQEGAEASCRPPSALCKPGERRCEGNGVMVCDADGQHFSTTACGRDVPYCTGAGECVACLTDGDCQGAGDCKRPVCKQGKCAAGAPDADFADCKTAIGSTGLCSEGECASLIALRSDISENASLPYLNAQNTMDPLSARGASIGPWETFLRISSTNPTALRSFNTKQFVKLSSDGFVYANGGMHAAGADRFMLGSGVIQTTTGRYLQCGPNDGKPDSARLKLADVGASAGPWEGLSTQSGTWRP